VLATAQQLSVRATAVAASGQQQLRFRPRCATERLGVAPQKQSPVLKDCVVQLLVGCSDGRSPDWIEVHAYPIGVVAPAFDSRPLVRHLLALAVLGPFLKGAIGQSELQHMGKGMTQG
jgi:hypothetical protein